MKTLKILMVEDVPIDAELSLRELNRAGIEFESRRVDTEPEFIEQCTEFGPDLILSDFELPQFDGNSALRLAQHFQPDVPFIFVSGTIGEETAIESLKRGATDYVLKTNLKRLASATHRALEEARERAARRGAERALRESEERFKIVARATNDALWDWSITTNHMWYNEGFTQQFGIDLGESVEAHANWQRCIHADDRQRVLDGIAAALAGERQFWSDEYRLTRSDGGEAYVLDRGYIVYDDERQPIRMIGAVMDLTRRRRTEEALLLRERAVEASVNPVLIVSASDLEMPIVYVNRAFEQVTGYAREDVLGRNCRFLQGQDRTQPELEKIRRAIAEQRDGHALLRNYRKDGSLFWNDLYVAPVRDPYSGALTHFVGVQYDVTEFKRYQDELEHQANYDGLTGLANRNLFKDRLQQAIALSHRSKRRFALAFLDLDNFKLVNDSLGHDTGDQLLEIAANRLNACVREGDTVARLGGDEFVLLLPEQHDDDAYRVVQWVLAEIARPFTIEQREFKVTCSVGIASYPRDGPDGETLLRNADAAMYRAKELGRNNAQLYSSEMNAHISERLALETELWRALERDEFLLHYQPKVEIVSGRITGLEALIRWRHPRAGMMWPAKFIGLAEETSLMVPIGNWVIRAACAQNKALQNAGLPAVPIAVNISARQFRDKTLVAAVRSALAASKLEPRYLELEVTETALMQNAEDAIRILSELSNIGVQIALDDFGTGYSSFTYLKRFPVDRLKIDQSFVRDISVDPDDAVIARSIIILGQEMGLAVTAEGVETEEQVTFLEANGCPEGQGYYFARPVPAEALLTLLEKGRLPIAA